MRYEVLKTTIIHNSPAPKVKIEVLEVHSDGDFGIKTPYAVSLSVDGYAGLHMEASSLNMARRTAHRLQVVIDDIIDTATDIVE